MLHSMTGYASALAETEMPGGRILCEWELRSVNGRGLDLRLRLPEGFGFLEKPLRDRLPARIARGNVTLSLRLRHDRAGPQAQMDDAALAALLSLLAQVQDRAAKAGLALRAPTSLDLLGWRGVQMLGQDSATIDPAELAPALLADLDPLLEQFCQTRQQEGAALGAILTAQLDQIVGLVAEARALLPARAAAMRALHAQIMAQFAEAAQIDPARLEQELAQQAVKLDVAEELDRLDAHCASARAFLAEGGAVGRRLDFLSQEFNREANTLCSKAQNLELTRIGLALKSVIDQLREQVQNLE